MVNINTFMHEDKQSVKAINSLARERDLHRSDYSFFCRQEKKNGEVTRYDLYAYIHKPWRASYTSDISVVDIFRV